MKFLHVSDLHVGKSLFGYDLRPFQVQILEQITDQIRENRPDALLISGDVLDKTQASDADMNLVARFISRARNFTRIIMISGNHDGASRLGFAQGLLQDGVDIFAKASQVGSAVEIPDSEGNLGALVYPIPYLYPFQDRQTLSYWKDSQGVEHPDAYLEQLHPELTQDSRVFLPASAPTVFAAALRRIGNDIVSRGRMVPLLAMAHDYLSGFAGNQIPKRVGTLEPIPSKLLDTLGGSVKPGQGLDYLALGHIHRSYKVSDSPITWYSGAPLPYRTTDSNQTHTLLVEITKKHQVTVEKLPLTPPYQVAQITTSMKQLNDPSHHEYDKYKDVFCSVVLNDVSLPPGAYQRAKEVFPRLLNLSHSDIIAFPNSESLKFDEKTTPLEVSKQFLEKYNTSPKEIKLLEELMELSLQI